MRAPIRRPSRTATTTVSARITWSASVALDLGGNDELGASVLYSDMRNWFDAAESFDSFLDKRAESYGLHLRKQHTAEWTSTLRFGHSVDALENQSSATMASRFDTTQRQLSWQHDVALGGGSLMAAYEFLQQRVQTTADYEKTRRHINAFLLAGVASSTATTCSSTPATTATPVRQQDHRQRGLRLPAHARVARACEHRHRLQGADLQRSVFPDRMLWCLGLLRRQSRARA